MTMTKFISAACFMAFACIIAILPAQPGSVRGEAANPQIFSALESLDKIHFADVVSDFTVKTENERALHAETWRSPATMREHRRFKPTAQLHLLSYRTARAPNQRGAPPLVI